MKAEVSRYPGSTFSNLPGSLTHEEAEAVTIEENFERWILMAGDSVVVNTNIFIDLVKRESAVAP